MFCVPANQQRLASQYALQHGYRLRPIFTFGETETFWNCQVGYANVYLVEEAVGCEPEIYAVHIGRHPHG